MVEIKIFLKYGINYSKEDIGNEVSRTYFNNRRSGESWPNAEAIKKFYSAKKFNDKDINVVVLNMMVSYLKPKPNYNSWDEFVAKEGEDNYAKSCDRTAEDYYKLDARIKAAIDFMVENRCMEFYMGRVRHKDLFLAKMGIMAPSISLRQKLFETYLFRQFGKEVLKDAYNVFKTRNRLLAEVLKLKTEIKELEAELLEIARAIIDQIKLEQEFKNDKAQQ